MGKSSIRGNKKDFSKRILSCTAEEIENNIQVPVYQRNYTWKDSHIEKLFEDFKDHLDSKSNFTYYLGNIVLVTDENRRVKVLDGQQRLTSLYILTAVIKLKLSEIHNEAITTEKDAREREFWTKDKEEFEKKLTNILVNEDKDVPHLLIYHKGDRNWFNHIVKSTDYNILPDRTSLKRVHRMYKASKLLYSLLDNYLNDKLKEFRSTDPMQILTNHFRELKEFAEFVVGESSEMTYTLLKEGDLEFTIFETLNNRGENLSCYDLTRNIMMSISVDFDDLHKTTMDIFDDDKDNDIYSIYENCKDSKGEKFVDSNATKLILDSWNMFNKGKINEGKYMKTFQDFIKTDKIFKRGGFLRKSAKQKEKFIEHLNLLHQCSFSLAELVNPREDMYTEFTGEPRNKKLLYQLLKDFKSVNFKQFYSVYFSLKYKKTKPKYIIKYINLIEKIYINLIYTFGVSPSKIENTMSDIAFDIFNSNDDIEELLKQHTKQFINWEGIPNSSFEVTFSKKNANQGQASYIFRKMYNFINSNQTTRLQDDVQVEHVMPKVGNQWFAKDLISTNEHKEFKERLGNKTLLTPIKNTMVSNKIYSEKLRYYKQQNISLTNADKNQLDKKFSVTYYKEWNTKSIDDRQKALAKVAKDIWGF